MASICSNFEMATLFVGNLHFDATKAELEERFTLYGPVSSVSIHSETILGRSHRFAYVDFRNEIDAKSAMETFNLELGSNCAIHLTWYKPDAGKVFISNLDTRMENMDLYEAFAQFGNILSCKIAKNHKGMSIGCAFVRFETEEAANSCIKFSNEKKLFEKEINVEIFNVCNEDELDKLDEKRKVAMQFKMAIRNSLFNSTEDSEQSKTDREVVLKSGNSFEEKSKESKKNEEKLDEKPKAIREFKMVIFKALCEQPEKDCDIEVMQVTSAMAFKNQVPDVELHHKENVDYQVAAQSEFKPITPIKVEEKNMIQTQQQQMEILTYRIQSQVERMFPGLASKLTARLMENDISPLLSIMEDQEAFTQKINELLLEIEFSKLFTN